MSFFTVGANETIHCIGVCIKQVSVEWGFHCSLIQKFFWSNFRIPGHIIYICRNALKNEV